MALPQIDSLESVLATQNFFPAEHFQMRGNHKTESIDIYLEWIHPSIPKPTEQDIGTWAAALQAANAALAQVIAEKHAIKSAADIAKQHAEKIRICVAAIPLADLASEDNLARYSRYREAMNDPAIPNGFRTLVLTAFGSEKGIALSMATDPASVTAANRQAFNDFYRAFFNTWATMLLASTE